LLTDKEIERLEKLYTKERLLWGENFRFVAGIDEAGRGSLAGPVVAGAVIFKEGIYIEKLDDSKKLTSSQRETLYAQIKNKAVAVGVGVVYQDEIDKINIFNATIKSMKLAIANLNIQPDFLLVDGLTIPELSIPQEKVIDGDARCCCIAAASIVAKVTRDHLMEELDKIYPQYGFAKHKGYGTAFHLQALKKYKPCDLHRKTFKPVAKLIET